MGHFLTVELAGVFAAASAMFGVVGGVVAGWRKWVRPVLRTVQGVSEAVLGRPESTDPATGLTVAGIEPLGPRLTRMEQSNDKVSQDTEYIIGEIHCIKRTVGSIDHEVRPNGGGSLADSVNRIHGRLGSGDDRFDRIEETMTKLTDAVNGKAS